MEVEEGEEEGEENENRSSQLKIPQYRGESSRSIYTRHQAHMTAYNQEDDKGFMWGHTVARCQKNNVVKVECTEHIERKHEEL